MKKEESCCFGLKKHKDSIKEFPTREELKKLSSPSEYLLFPVTLTILKVVCGRKVLLSDNGRNFHLQHRLLILVNNGYHTVDGDLQVYRLFGG